MHPNIWNVRTRSTRHAAGLLAIGAVLSVVAPTAAEARSPFVKSCKTARSPYEASPAMLDVLVQQFGMSAADAADWLQTEDRVMGLIKAMQGKGRTSDSTSLAGTYYEARFDNAKRQVHFAMSSHRFDDAVRACGRAKGIHGTSIVFDVLRWPVPQLDAAMAQLRSSLSDLVAADVVSFQRFSVTDVILVTVYAKATDEQFAAVQAAAAKLPVAVEVSRVPFDEPRDIAL